MTLWEVGRDGRQHYKIQLTWINGLKFHNNKWKMFYFIITNGRCLMIENEATLDPVLYYRAIYKKRRSLYLNLKERRKLIAILHVRYDFYKIEITY